jgi:hypothetical protein
VYSLAVVSHTSNQKADRGRVWRETDQRRPTTTIVRRQSEAARHVAADIGVVGAGISSMSRSSVRRPSDRADVVGRSASATFFKWVSGKVGAWTD